MIQIFQQNHGTKYDMAIRLLYDTQNCNWFMTLQQNHGTASSVA